MSSAIDVARYILEVEFSKLDALPFDPVEIDDINLLAEEVARYHDAPRNSPTHAFAALTDGNLRWFRMSIPADRIIMGPGDPASRPLVVQAKALVSRFVQLVNESENAALMQEYSWDREIDFPLVPCVLVDYHSGTPFLPEPKGDYGAVYRLLDGYHRTFTLVARGQTEVESFVGIRVDGEPWAGNFAHLDRWEDDHWIPKEA